MNVCGVPFLRFHTKNWFGQTEEEKKQQQLIEESNTARAFVLVRNCQSVNWFSSNSTQLRAGRSAAVATAAACLVQVCAFDTVHL